MKILITGKHSFIGSSFETYILKEKENWSVCKITLRDEKWKCEDWKSYDVILHVAGIAQVDSGTVSTEQETLYHRINGELTLDVARKAKESGIHHFIYLSSMMVYGNAGIGIISKGDLPNPQSVYGMSKLEGEEISKLKSQEFCVTIIRIPMVYGNSHPGEIGKWWKLSRFFFFFPKIDNYRGMIYIENLCKLLQEIIRKPYDGIICPQNSKTISTSDLMRLLRKLQGRRTLVVPGFQWIIQRMCCHIVQARALLNNIGYDDKILQTIPYDYQLYSVEESLQKTFVIKTTNARQNVAINPVEKALRKTGIGPFVRKRMVYRQYHQDTQRPTLQMIGSLKFFRQNENEVKSVISLLADEKSRIIYEKAIRFRCTHDVKDAPEYDLKNRYSPKDIHLVSDEYFLVRSWDDLQYTKNAEYIALDLDGAEMDALFCLERQIIERQPQLAVCIYHLDEDFLRIIRWLNGLDLGYLFYIRNHDFDLNGVTLYAIKRFLYL